MNSKKIINPSNNFKNVNDLNHIPKSKHLIKKHKYKPKYTWDEHGIPLFSDNNKIYYNTFDKRILKDINIKQFPYQYREKVTIINIYI